MSQEIKQLPKLMSCPERLEWYRVVLHGHVGDNENGAMLIKPKGLMIMFSSGLDWEHVSVSKRFRTPSYKEMDWVKRQFWKPEACVVQYHVPDAEHIDVHPYCLHLWRSLVDEFPMPPPEAVG